MNEYRSDEEYRLAIDAFHNFCGILLFAFAKHPCKTKDIIIRNFIARTDTMMRAILQLWSISDFQDCWILHRCLFDRLFHLVYLDDNDQFELFDNWSFIRQYNAQNRVRSDTEFIETLDSQMFTPTSEQKERYNSLSNSKAPHNWTRPRAETIAKGMNLEFLYKYGYDYGSTHVHPMANDGERDFFTITGLAPAPNFPDQRSVISNSILVSCLIIQEGLCRSNFKWRSIIFDFLEHLLEYLQTGSPQYGETLKKLILAGSEFDVCEPIDKE